MAGGGAVIAVGAAEAATVVGAPEGAATMALGAGVTAIGGGFSFVGMGMQVFGSVVNAIQGGGGRSLVSAALDVAAFGANKAIGHFLPGLPEALGPANPVDVASQQFGQQLSGGGTCQ